MKKMRFSEKQNDVTITTPEEGVTDVVILTNETVVTEKNEQSESDEEITYYEYDGNIFRTYKTITEETTTKNDAVSVDNAYSDADAPVAESAKETTTGTNDGESVAEETE